MSKMAISFVTLIGTHTSICRKLLKLLVSNLQIFDCRRGKISKACLNFNTRLGNICIMIAEQNKES